MLIRFVQRAGEVFRVLLELPEGSWIISYDEPVAPLFVSLADAGSLERIPTPETFLAEFNRQDRSPAETAKLALIQPLLKDEVCITDRKTRLRVAKDISAESGHGQKTILRNYYRYLATGALTARRKPSTPQRNPDFDWAIQKFYFSSKRLSLRASYEMMLVQRFSDVNGQLLPDAPTWPSFRHYYYSRNYNKQPQKVIAREGLSHYQRNCRPIFGTASQWRPVPGAFQMDAKRFFCKQILYLTVECPSDCSVKSLALNLVSALDRAIGSNYLHQLTSLRSVAASAVAAQVKILCLTHHVGLILIDEIQNAVVTARKNRQIKPLIKFLVELTNDTCTSVFFVGTPDAEALFVSQEHLKRRTRGIRLLPFKPDGAYRAFLDQLWPYQLTPASAPLTNQLANKLYDCSGGIPAYLVKIFQESQAQALLQGRSCIDTKTMQRAIDLLAIKVPRTFVGGTYISDFEFAPDIGAALAEPVDISANLSVPEIPAEETSNEVPRLFANKRGRPSTERDAADLIVALKTGADLLGHLRSLELLEVF